MPTYSITDPDGRTHTIDGPAGATREQVIAEIQRQLPYEQRTVSEQLPIDWREAGLGTIARQGFNRAMTGLGSTVTDLIPALAGSALGFKGYAAEQLAENKAKMEASEAENPTAFKSFRDIRGVGDVAGYVAETFGELIPDIVALMTGAGTAGVVGRQVAIKGVEKLVATRAAEAVAERGLVGEAATKFTKEFTEKMVERAAPVIARAGAEGSATGLKYGLPASSYALNAPDVFGSIYEKTEEQSPGIAALMGVPIAMLDTFLPGQILNKLGMAGKAKLGMAIISDSKVLPGTFKDAALKELGTVVAGEGLTESAQEALTVAAEMMAGAKGDFFSQENIDRYINAGLKGAIGGGAFGTPGAIRSGFQAKGEKDRLADEAKARAEEETQPGYGPQLPPFVGPPAPPEIEGPQLPSFVGPPAPPEIEGPQLPSFVGLPAPPEIEGPQLPPFVGPPAPPEIEGPQLPPFVGPQLSPERAALAVFKVTDSTLTDLGFNKGAIKTSKTAKELRGLDLTTFDGLATFEKTLRETKTKYNPQAAAALINKARDLQYTQTKQEIPEATVIGAQPYTATEQQEIEFAQQRRTAGLPITPRQEYLLRQYAPQIALPQQATPQSLVTQPSVGAGPRVNEQEVPNGNVPPVAPAAGASPSVSSEPISEQPTTGGTAASGIGGVEDAQPSAGTTSVGEGAQSGALTRTKENTPVPSDEAMEDAGLTDYEIDGYKRRPDYYRFNQINNGYKYLGGEFRQVTKDDVTEMRSLIARDKIEYNKDKKKLDDAFSKEEIPQVSDILGSDWNFNSNTQNYKDAAYAALSRKHGFAARVLPSMERILTRTQSTPTKAAPAKAVPKRPIKGFGAGKAKAAPKAAPIKVAPKATTTAVVPVTRKKVASKIPTERKILKPSGVKVAPRPPAPPKTTATQVQEIGQKKLRSDIAAYLSKVGNKRTEINGILNAYEDNLTAKDVAEIKRDYPMQAVAPRVPEGLLTDKEITKFAKEGNPDELALFESLDSPLDSRVVDALNKGDFTGAMRLMASDKDPRIAKLASRLLEAAVNPKVKVVKGLKNELGQSVAGLYDPRTNTIRLDSVNGMNAHTLIHETGHSALSHVLEDANHPVTRQMQRLLDDVKDLLDTAYGAQDVQEFAAEAMSNPEFRSKLNTMNPGGGKTTAWERFRNIVANFFRRLVGLTGKPIEDTVLDKVDQLIDGILSPAPESRDAGALYAAALKDKGFIKKMFNAATDITARMPLMNRERADAINQLIRDATTFATRTTILAALPLNALGEVAKTQITPATEITKLVDERAGKLQKANEQIEALVIRANRWATAAGKAMVETFNDTVYNSTTRGVDPTRKESYYAAKPKADGTVSPEAADEARKAIAAYREVTADYNKLNDSGQALYREMRDAYKEMYKRIEAALDSKIDEALEGQEDKKTVKETIFRRLLEKAQLDPYFPLTRSGNKWLAYNGETGRVDEDGSPDYRIIESFDTERERERRMTELEDDPVRRAFIKKANPGATEKTIEAFSKLEPYSNLSQMNYARVPSTSFINDVIKTLSKGVVGKNGKQVSVPKENIEAIVKLFLDTLPETAFAKSFQKRKGTAGYERDAIGALQKTLFRNARQITNMEYAAKLNKALKDMEDFVKTTARSVGDDRTAIAFVEEYRKRIAFINNPTVPAWSQFITSTGFNMLLGLNPASAFVNLSQVPMVTLPYLGGEYNYSDASSAIMDAYKTFTGSGRSKTSEIFGTEGVTTTRSAAYSLDNYGPKSKEYAKYKTLIEVMGKMGQMSSSQVYDTLDAESQVTMGSKVNAITGWMFHHAERTNRQVTAIAAYNLEMAKLKKKGITGEVAEQQAADHAVYIAEITQGGTSSASAPRIAQNEYGRIVFMFKRYGVSMLYLQLKQLRTAFLDSKVDDKTRKAAMAQFAGITGMAALFAGLQGIPFFGVAAMIYNLFKDDDDDDLAMATRSYFGTMLTYGPVSSLTNLDFSGRVSMTNLLFRDMRTGDTTTPVDVLLHQLGGAPLGVLMRLQQGLKLMSEGNTERGMEQVLPSAIGNVLKGTRFYAEGANTLRGDPITGEVSAWNAGAQAFGFSPADYQRTNEVNNRIKGVDKRVTAEQSSLARKYYIAKRNGDFESQTEYREELQELFRKHPGLGSLQSYLESSLKAHEATTKRMVNGIVVNQKLAGELEKYRREMGD